MSDDIRVGQGVDVHPLVTGRPLVLGGVRIEWPEGLAGHSDADVVAHAVCDALLGAAGFGDLGTLFPASDDRWRGASSLVFCREVGRLLAANGWAVGNVDVTVLCDAPRLGAHVGAMQRELAGAIGIDPSRIRVGPKSTEGLGFAGRGDGIAALATCLVRRSADA